MIRLLRGSIYAVQNDYLILNLGGPLSGIAVKVQVPAPTLAQLRPDDTCELHSYLQVREDALTLFGFESADELEMFELLLTVNGVGPKVALATLSTLTPDALRLALSSEEPGMVARVPGIGKRTAQKIILELKDKVAPPIDGLESLAQTTDADSEVVEALIALGYSVVEAQRAVQGLPKDVESVEERLRIALSQFGG